jgi:hypothetical protein
MSNSPSWWWSHWLRTFHSSVGPPSLQWWMWWASQSVAGIAHPGQPQTPSRTWARRFLDVPATVGVRAGEDVVVDVHDHLDGGRAGCPGRTVLAEHRLADPRQGVAPAGASGIVGRVEVDARRGEDLILDLREGHPDDRALVGGRRSGDPEHVLLVAPPVEKALGPLCAVALGTGALLVPRLAAAPCQLGVRGGAGHLDPRAVIVRVGDDTGAQRPHPVDRELAGGEGVADLGELTGGLSGGHRSFALWGLYPRLRVTQSAQSRIPVPPAARTYPAGGTTVALFSSTGMPTVASSTTTPPHRRAPRSPEARPSTPPPSGSAATG